MFDRSDFEPTWTSGATLDTVRGRTIALRTYLVNARLYAIHRELGDSSH